MQLRQKLFLVLSLMTIVPLLFLLFGVVARIESDLEQRASEEVHKTLGKMSQEIYTLMHTQQSLAQGLAKVPVVREFAALVGNRSASDYETKAQALASFFLNYQSTVPSIQAVRFSRLDGKTLVKVKEGHLVPASKQGEDAPAYVEDIAYKPFFQRAVDSHHQVVVSDFERGKVAGEVDFCPAMLRYSVPIRDELDTRLGLLTVNIWGKRVDDAVEATLGGYPGKAYIVEINDKQPARDGVYLYHENPDWRFSNQLGTGYRLSKALGEDLWQRIKRGGINGMVEADNDRLLFYRKYSPYVDRPTQWLLVIEVARDTVLASIWQIRNWIAVLIAAVLVVSLLIARWAAARLAEPVHNLAQIITRYADGDSQVRYREERTDEIGVAGRAFNYLSESLEQAERERDRAEHAVRQSERLAAIGEMAAGIGHEINNPLMNIMSLADLIEQSVPPQDTQMRQDLEALQKEGHRCARIVQGILNFARETRPRYERFDMAELIDNTLNLFRHRVDSSGLTTHGTIERPLKMEGDPNQLQQVLVNVMLNAIQASPDQSTLTINAWRQDDKVHVTILDNGVGLDEEALSKAFNPFFTTKPEGAGTGLGLSVSYGIVRKHDGSISLANRRDASGVRVDITLPIANRGSQTEPTLPEVSHAN